MLTKLDDLTLERMINRRGGEIGEPDERMKRRDGSQVYDGPYKEPVRSTVSTRATLAAHHLPFLTVHEEEIRQVGQG